LKIETTANHAKEKLNFLLQMDADKPGGYYHKDPETRRGGNQLRRNLGKKEEEPQTSLISRKGIASFCVRKRSVNCLVNNTRKAEPRIEFVKSIKSEKQPFSGASGKIII
jgi:hypothetical protein